MSIIGKELFARRAMDSHSYSQGIVTKVAGRVFYTAYPGDTSVKRWIPGQRDGHYIMQIRTKTHHLPAADCVDLEFKDPA